MSAPVRRVVLTGSESTGKTTLATQLAQHYGVPMVPEFVRGYAERKRAPLETGDHWPIARGQVMAQDTALARARDGGLPLLLLDTDLVSHVVYCEHYTGGCDSGIRALARERLADHYLLLDIDVPWVADGVRDRGDQRETLHAHFVEALEQLGAPYTLVRGSWHDRFTRAVRVIDGLLTRA